MRKILKFTARDIILNYHIKKNHYQIINGGSFYEFFKKNVFKIEWYLSY